MNDHILLYKALHEIFIIVRLKFWQNLMERIFSCVKNSSTPEYAGCDKLAGWPTFRNQSTGHDGIFNKSQKQKSCIPGTFQKTPGSDTGLKSFKKLLNM